MASTDLDKFLTSKEKKDRITAKEKKDKEIENIKKKMKEIADRDTLLKKMTTAPASGSGTPPPGSGSGSPPAGTGRGSTPPPSAPSSSNPLTQLKAPQVYRAIGLLIFCLVIILFFLMFKANKQTEQTVSIILFFAFLLIVICIQFVPNFKAVRKLFQEISNIFYILIYVVFLILFFTLMPEDTLNKYGHLITPITLALGVFMFYKSFAYNYNETFNINYERIRAMIMMFSLITIFIVFYDVDPGGYIHKYFGHSLLLTIILSVFAFLYLMILLTLPSSKSSLNEANFLKNFSGISKYGSIAFLLFIITIAIIVSTKSGVLFGKDKNGGTTFLLLFICILWGSLLMANMFPEAFDKSLAFDKLNIFKRSLLTLFGIIIACLFIYWFVYNIHRLSGTSSIVSFGLNLLLMITILGLIYKTIYVKLPVGNTKKNAFFELIISLIFYIPCFFSSIFDSVGNFAVGEKYGSDMGSLMMLVLAIVLLVGYYFAPSLFNKVNLQGGKQLINQPVYTDTMYSLGTYQELNGSDVFDYQYAISFWVFLDGAGPNTSAAYSKFTSLLNFGNKPNVLYNGKTNTLLITMQQKDFKENNQNKLIDFDENGNRILYKNENMLLQKWNNIIINYSGGVLDIFLNGELVKSDIGVVPYYTLDNLTIGEEDGIKGGMCNVVYFNRALNASNIYYLYNMVKNKNLPVLNDSNKTILIQNVNTTNEAIKEGL